MIIRVANRAFQDAMIRNGHDFVLEIDRNRSSGLSRFDTLSTYLLCTKMSRISCKRPRHVEENHKVSSDTEVVTRSFSRES
jgi:hypothetical protein